MAKRRADGEGTISKRTDGRWEGRISLGYGADGKRKRRVVYARTQRECREKLDELRRSLNSGVTVGRLMSVEAYLAQWLADKQTQVKPRTAEIYQSLIELHIDPWLGHLRLDKLLPLHVQGLVTKLTEDVGAPTANKARRCLFGAMKQAVRWQLIPRNPVEAVNPVKEEKREMILWTAEEAARFLDTAHSHRLYAAFYLLMATGLRRGELLGLKWSDLEGDQLTVRRSLTTRGGKPAWSTPKTERGYRVVTVAPDVVSVLAGHRQRQDAERLRAGSAWSDEGLMFSNELGHIVTPIAFQHHWVKLQQAAKVRRIWLHDLRHLHVSLLVRRGLDARTIADRVGHTDPAFTMRRYAHLFAQQRQAAAIDLRDLLGSGRPTN